MKYFEIGLLIFIAVFMYTPNGYADLTDATVIAESGEWSVRKSTDPMTDKASCVALYQSDFDIQVNEGKFYLSMRGRGGLKGFEYRLDDQQSSGMKIPGDIMKKLDVVKISGPKFEQLLTAKRLRIQVVTFVRGLQNFDINLNGLSEVYPVLTSAQCK